MIQTWKCEHCAKKCEITLDVDRFSLPKFCPVFAMSCSDWKLKEAENDKKENQ